MRQKSQNCFDLYFMDRLNKKLQQNKNKTIIVLNGQRREVYSIHVILYRAISKAMVNIPFISHSFPARLISPLDFKMKEETKLITYLLPTKRSHICVRH